MKPIESIISMEIDPVPALRAYIGSNFNAYITLGRFYMLKLGQISSLENITQEIIHSMDHIQSKYI